MVQTSLMAMPWPSPLAPPGEWWWHMSTVTYTIQTTLPGERITLCIQHTHTGMLTVLITVQVYRLSTHHTVFLFLYSCCTVNIHILSHLLTGTHFHTSWGAPGLSGITVHPPPTATPTPMVAPTPPTQPFTVTSDSPGPSQRGVWHRL